MALRAKIGRDEAAGRAKRQVGEWTGNTGTQVDGATRQVKGKVEKAVGNIKDAVHETHNQMHTEHDPNRVAGDRGQDRATQSNRP